MTRSLRSMYRRCFRRADSEKVKPPHLTLRSIAKRCVSKGGQPALPLPTLRDAHFVRSSGRGDTVETELALASAPRSGLMWSRLPS